jgi:hypothetical protein
MNFFIKKTIRGYLPAILPNKDGFEFIGEDKKTGHFVKCQIKKCPITNLHFVKSGLLYKNIFAWYRIGEIEETKK